LCLLTYRFCQVCQYLSCVSNITESQRAACSIGFMFFVCTELHQPLIFFLCQSYGWTETQDSCVGIGYPFFPQVRILARSCHAPKRRSYIKIQCGLGFWHKNGKPWYMFFVSLRHVVGLLQEMVGPDLTRNGRRSAHLLGYPVTFHDVFFRDKNGCSNLGEAFGVTRLTTSHYFQSGSQMFSVSYEVCGFNFLWLGKNIILYHRERLALAVDPSVFLGEVWLTWHLALYSP